MAGAMPAHRMQEANMDAAIRSQILSILAGNRDMTIATLRPDGWPQATTVGFANDGFTLYFLCGLESQKAANLARDDRVSITIDRETPQVMEITGLSMAARAERVTSAAEAAKALRLLMARYPEQRELSIPMPKPSEVAIFRVTPTVISVLDYTKGFAHTDLVILEREKEEA
jgi:nitroimidazol reductase NimA-like FMN-containing flavoprotein (pyridoxamine 5'-phosphate oxidase superfamily)